MIRAAIEGGALPSSQNRIRINEQPVIVVKNQFGINNNAPMRAVYEDIEYTANTNGQQLVSVPTSKADLLINGLYQSRTDFSITNGFLLVPSELLVEVGDKVTIKPS